MSDVPAAPRGGDRPRPWMAEGAPCGFLTLGADDRIDYINDTLLDWLERDRSDVQGKLRLHDVLSRPGAIFLQTHLLPLLRLNGAFQEVVLPIRSTTGVERRTLVAGRRVDAAGQSVLIFYLSDQRQRFDLELARLRETAQTRLAWLRQVENMANIGAWSYDVQTHALTWSDQVFAIHGLPIGPEPTPDQALAACAETGRPRRRIEAALRRAVRTGVPFQFETTLRTGAGRRNVRTHGGAEWEKGRVRRIVGILQDVTERHEARAREEEQMRRAAESQKFESLGKLTGGISHDFNNLLAVILANGELLRETETDAERVQMIDSLLRATQRGAELARNLLAFARRAPLAPQTLDLNDLVRDTLRLAARTLHSTVGIETSLRSGLWTIEADPASTESALLNLIVNANDAMAGAGRLTIETSNLCIDDDYIEVRGETIAPGRYVMLAVSDTGTGIAQDVIGRIFDPFFTTKGPDGGSGLGLSMVMGFVRQTGGTVRVYSEVGVGTTVTLYFPARTGDTQALAPPPPQASDTSGSGQRVLLVEDSPDVLLVLSRVLRRAGYDVTEAASGDIAFRLFTDDPTFDLVLTDIVMPGTLQGPALARALRERVAGLPVVFMSGYAAEATIHGNGLRPEDVRLMKPIQRSDLLAALSGALARRGAKGP